MYIFATLDIAAQCVDSAELCAFFVFMHESDTLIKHHADLVQLVAIGNALPPFIRFLCC